MSAPTQLVVVSDLHGIFRGKRLAPGKHFGRDSAPLKMPLSVLFPDVWGRDLETTDHLMNTGDLDGTVRGIERPSVRLPAGPDDPGSELQLTWFFEADGTPYPVDPRQALAAVLRRFEATKLTPVCALELEFYLYDPNRSPLAPPRRPGSNQPSQENDVYSLTDLEAFAPFLDELYQACADAEVAVDAAIAEYGRGQFEVNLKHQDNPLRAADDAQLLKYLVKRVANRHGLAATFMAKPLGDDLGNGLHMHWSLLDETGRNVFAGNGEAGSTLLKSAVAGILEALPAAMLLLAPHYNSYRRFSAESLAPTRLTWGYENRTTALRIPAGEDANRRIEHRVAGADANPYLALAVMLATGLWGIEQALVPPTPLEGNGYESDAPRLPITWPAAIDCFAASELMATCFDPLLVHLLLAAKTQELQRFTSTVSAFEYETYLDRF